MRRNESRSLRFARRIAGAISGAMILENPAGSPLLRNVILVQSVSIGDPVEPAHTLDWLSVTPVSCQWPPEEEFPESLDPPLELLELSDPPDPPDPPRPEWFSGTVVEPGVVVVVSADC